MTPNVPVDHSDRRPDVLVLAIGSHGDVHPFLGVALRLKERGHRVRLGVNDFFRPLAEQVGLETISLGKPEEYIRLAESADLWKAGKGHQVVFGAIAEHIRPTYRVVAEQAAQGNTIVVGAPLAIGARVAQEKLGVPYVTLNLQPSLFRSLYDPPRLHGFVLMRPGAPAWWKRLQFWIADKVIDSAICPSLNAFRAELGLTTAVRGIWTQYWNSPLLAIGMFPSWFVPEQPDWPPQVRLTGFPLYDERGATPMPPDLRQFLEDGDPPVAFTFGSAMWDAQRLLHESAQACRLLRCRGILLTRRRQQVPDNLPTGVIHVDYAPLSELLPHCAAMVHHGGIGTSSQALAAGVPHLVVPHAHDQHDNAHRLQRLGVAATLSPARYRAENVARSLAPLLVSPVIADACRTIADKFRGKDALGETCDLIEAVAPSAIAAPVG